MPEQTYYPCWKVRLTVRLEEFNDSGTPRAKKKLVTQLKGKKPSRDGALKVGPDPSAPSGTTRYLLNPATAAADAPQDVQKSADNLTFRLGSIIPRKLTWKANGIREADQVTFEAKYLDFPFDPRVIRSIAVEVYVGTVTAKDFALGIGGELRTSLSGNPQDGEPLNVVPDNYLDANGIQRSNLRFQGWVDVLEHEWPDEDEPFVNFQCRDNTTLLIDQDAASMLAIDDQKGIAEATAVYLSNYPQFAGLAVEYRPAGVEVPKLGDALAGTAFKPHIGPTPTKQGGAAGSKLSVWDYLTDMCGAIGHICKVEGTTLVLQRARTATSHGGGQRPTDPFRHRDHDGVAMDRRTLIYGRNLKSMKCGRKYSKTTPQSIECRCYSQKRKKTLVARFPEVAASPKGPILPGDDRAESRVQVVRIAGVEDDKAMRIIAQSWYETLGRGELNFHLKTKSLGSWGGGNEDTDLLDVQPGDAIDVYIHRDEVDELCTANNIEAVMLVQQSAERFLLKMGYPADFAKAYAQAYQAVGYQTTFVVRGFSCDCNLEDGITLDYEVVNYVSVRADVTLPEGEEQPSDTPAGIPGETLAEKNAALGF
jgi:hypothetical protein